MAQTLFRVERHQTRGDWFIVRDGVQIAEHGSREEATTEAQKLAMSLEREGVQSRIECLRDDGSVSDRWYYGGAEPEPGMRT